MVNTAKAAFNLHICNKSYLVCEYKVQQTTLVRKKLLLMCSRDSWIACALLLSCSITLYYNSDATPTSFNGQIQTLHVRSRCCFTIKSAALTKHTAENLSTFVARANITLEMYLQFGKKSQLLAYKIH